MLGKLEQSEIGKFSVTVQSHHCKCRHDEKLNKKQACCGKT